MRNFEKAVESIEKAKEYNTITRAALSQYYIYEMLVRLELAQGHPAAALAFADSIKQMDITVDNKIAELRADALLQVNQGMEAAQIYRNLFIQMAEKNRELAEKNIELQQANERAEESSKMKTEFIKNDSRMPTSRQQAEKPSCRKKTGSPCE